MLELDELWTFVGKRENARWLWIALCRRTRQVVSWILGDRDSECCKRLHDGIPSSYANLHTTSDFWASYDEVFALNISSGKETGQTDHVERIHGTLRHFLKRLTRKTIAFPKSQTVLVERLSIFFHFYNLSKRSI